MASSEDSKTAMDSSNTIAAFWPHTLPCQGLETTTRTVGFIASLSVLQFSPAKWVAWAPRLSHLINSFLNWIVEPNFQENLRNLSFCWFGFVFNYPPSAVQGGTVIECRLLCLLSQFHMSVLGCWSIYLENLGKMEIKKIQTDRYTVAWNTKIKAILFLVGVENINSE